MTTGQVSLFPMVELQYLGESRLEMICPGLINKDGCQMLDLITNNGAMIILLINTIDVLPCDWISASRFACNGNVRQMPLSLKFHLRYITERQQHILEIGFENL